LPYTQAMEQLFSNLESKAAGKTKNIIISV
jgi:hypothetical protein